MNKLICWALLLSIFYNLEGMEKAKPSLSGPATIQLLSETGESFVVPKEIAQQSLLLHDFLASHPGDAEFPMLIPSPLLKWLAASMWAFKNLKGKNLFDAVYHDLSNEIAPTISEDASQKLEEVLEIPITHRAAQLHKYFPLGLCIALFNISAKFEFSPLFQLMGRELMQFMLADPSLFPYIKSKMRDEEIWREEFARWYNLLTRGKNMEGIDPDAYSFSIREFIDYNSMPWHLSSSTQLDLSRCRIGSLDGLNEINNIQAITQIVLSENKLMIIPKGAFVNFPNLKSIFLNMNKIKKIEPGAFPPNLEFINLENNQIVYLEDKNTFPRKALNLLSLSWNKIKYIAPGVIPESVRFIYLSRTELKDLKFLASLTSLKYLELNHVSLTYIDPNWLPLHLEQAWFIGTPLSEENKEAMRQKLPNAHLHF